MLAIALLPGVRRFWETLRGPSKTTAPRGEPQVSSLEEPDGNGEPVRLEPFIRWRCVDCGADIEWPEPIYPGQVAVQRCVCEAQWAMVAPPCRPIRAKDLHLKEDQVVVAG